MAVAKYYDTATSAWRPLMPGPIGILWRFDWSATADYRAMDAVKFNRSSYLCIADVAATATTPADDPAHWGVLAEGGVDGAGTVSTVAGVAPDAGGNVPLGPANVGAATAAQGALAASAIQPTGSVTITHIWSGTQAEYDAIVTKDATTLYVVGA